MSRIRNTAQNAKSLKILQWRDYLSDYQRTFTEWNYSVPVPCRYGPVPYCTLPVPYLPGKVGAWGVALEEKRLPGLIPPADQQGHAKRPANQKQSFNQINPVVDRVADLHHFMRNMRIRIQIQISKLMRMQTKIRKPVVDHPGWFFTYLLSHPDPALNLDHVKILYVYCVLTVPIQVL